MYQVLKILNNNTILAKEDDNEIIVMAKGIGFGKKIDEHFEIPPHAKKYMMQKNYQAKDKQKKVIDYINPVYLEIAAEIIKEATNKFKEVNFTQSAYYQLESAKRGFLLAIAKIGGYYYNVEHNLTSYLFWIYKALEHEGVHCEVQWKQIQQFISKYSLWGFIEETKKCAIQNAVIAQFILAKYYKIEFPNESVFWMEQFNNNPNGAEYVKREYKSMKASLPFDV